MRIPFVMYGFDNKNAEQSIVSVVKQVFHVQVLEIENHKFYFEISQKRLGIDNGYYTHAMQMFALELNKEVKSNNISFNCDLLVPYGIATKILKSKYGRKGVDVIACLSWYGDQCILSVKDYLATDFSKGEKKYERKIY